MRSEGRGREKEVSEGNEVEDELSLSSAMGDGEAWVILP